VSWRDGDGKRKTESFAEEKDRDSRAANLKQMKRRCASSGVPFDPVAWAEFVAFRKRTEYAPLDQIAEVWIARRPMTSITVGEAVGRYLAEKGREQIGTDSMRHYKVNMARFTSRFGAAKLGLVEPEAIKEFIDTLPFAPYTKDSHHRCLRTFFSHAVLHDWIASDPMKKVKRIRITDTEINTLTVEEGRRLFAANREQRCIGRLALEAFAGIRFSSAGKIVRANLRFEEEGLEIPAVSIKTRSREYIDGLPGNLWAWLRHAPKECWDMTPRQYLQEKSMAFVRAGVSNTGNVLRHSFCSYHYAAFKNPPLTAAILCHTNLKTMHRHYKGRASESDGKAWFGLYP
jgi:integrase